MPKARARSMATCEVGHLEGEVVRPRPAGGEEAGQEVVDLDVPGHEHLDPGGVGEPELGGGEPGAGAARVPLGPEVGGVAVPDVLPAGDGVGDVVEDGALDARVTRWVRSTSLQPGRDGPGPVDTAVRRPRAHPARGRGAPCRVGEPPVRSAHGLPHEFRSSTWPPRSGADRCRPSELVDHALGQVAAHNGTLNAFVAVDEGRARAAAATVDALGGGAGRTRDPWPASPSG